jgi:hypothetical protein
MDMSSFTFFIEVESYHYHFWKQERLHKKQNIITQRVSV